MGWTKAVFLCSRCLAILTWVGFLGCSVSVVGPQDPKPEPPVQSWSCTNDLEVSCGEENCEVESGEAFTPMSVTLDDSGVMSVCAYSGCWEGSGEVVKGETFLVLIGHGLPFSTNPDSNPSRQDIVIAIDRTDQIGVIKVADFAQPLLCTPSEASS